LLLSFSLNLPRKTLCIYLPLHFPVVVLKKILPCPSMFLTPPLSLLPFSSFHLKHLLACPVCINFSHSVHQFFPVYCSRLMTMRGRLLSHAHHTGPYLAPPSARSLFCHLLSLF